MKKFFKELQAVFWPLLLSFVSFRLVVQTDLLFVSRFGENAMAAFAFPPRVMIIDHILAISLAPLFSVLVANSSQPLRAIRRSITFGGALGVFLTFIGFAIYPPLNRALIEASQVAELSQTALWWLTLSIWPRFLTLVMTMILHGTGHGKQVLLLRVFEIFINLIFNTIAVMGLSWGFEGIFISTVLGSFVSFFAVSVIFIKAFGFKSLAPISFKRLGIREFIAFGSIESARASVERMVELLTLSLFGWWFVAELALWSVALEYRLVLSVASLALMRASAIVLANNKDFSLLDIFSDLVQRKNCPLFSLLLFFGISVVTFFFIPTVYGIQINGSQIWALQSLSLSLGFFTVIVDFFLRSHFYARQKLQPLVFADLGKYVFLMVALGLSYGFKNSLFIWFGVAGSSLASSISLARAICETRTFKGTPRSFLAKGS